jgi:hypothetical protein
MGYYDKEKIEKIKNSPELEYYKNKLRELAMPYKSKKRFFNHHPEEYLLAKELDILNDLKDWYAHPLTQKWNRIEESIKFNKKYYYKLLNING